LIINLAISSELFLPETIYASEVVINHSISYFNFLLRFIAVTL